ncbi:hypothetical protein DFA_08545 [Cavenderia fasciculata]|uniref:Ankyrin repeat-containing protein n=1 Tax=Cavenderia fasciculata TaxID=261658 RepID=F4Q2Y5_CACFS|nr:uncharacterized protein DFA_08545 [Cavenderia fasciculata]EGG17549.1 hypothetical protein DFA_08545 [Cavenderia fasciculata]|eukprot:XP_004356033.1 hypothetical protein DFA_08545 [Cavenderia fasciculata]
MASVNIKAANLEKQFISNVGELFKYLDNLTLPSGHRVLSTGSSVLGDFDYKLEKGGTLKGNNNSGSSNKSSSFVKVESKSFKNTKDKNMVAASVFYLFQDQLSPCLNAINHCRTMRAMSLADIFRERMVKTKTLLTEAKAQHYLSLIQYYLRMVEGLMIEKQKVLVDTSHQMVAYLTNYTTDVDSCVVGLIPNDDLLNKLARDYEILKLTDKEKGSGKDNVHGGETAIEDSATFQATTISTTREQLLINIINWSALSDTAQIAKAVRRYASILRGVDKLKKGDLVVVRFHDYHNMSKSMKKTIIGFKSSMNSSTGSTSQAGSASGGPTSAGNVNGNTNTSADNLSSIANSVASTQGLYSSGVSSFAPSSYSSNASSTLFHHNQQHIIQPQPHQQQGVVVGTTTTPITPTHPPTTNTNNNTTHQWIQQVKTQKTSFSVPEYLEKKSFKPKAQFARYTGERGDYSLNLWFSAEESETVVVGIEDILPLNKQTLEALRDLRMIEKLIYQPTETFFSQVLEESKQQTINYLLSLGVDINLLLNTSSFTLFDLERLKITHSTLATLYNTPDHPFYKELEKEMTERIDAHVATVDQRFLFMPRYETTIADLRGCQHIALARSKVKQFLGDCELVLDQLKIQKRNLMNGTMKEEMTEWWLKRIDSRVSDFLSERGYNFVAVPENYIEQPPTNMKDVISNLILIQKILDPREHVIEIIQIQDDVESKLGDGQDDHTSDSNGGVDLATADTISNTSGGSRKNTLSRSSSICITNNNNSSGNSSTATTNEFDDVKPSPPTPKIGAYIRTSDSGNDQATIGNIRTSGGSIPVDASSYNKQQQQQIATTTTTTTAVVVTTTDLATGANTSASSEVGSFNDRPILTQSNKFLNSPLQLVRELKEEIYPVIGEFIKKARIVICEHFDIQPSEFHNTLCTKLLDEQKKQPAHLHDQQTIIWIEDMLSDLVYLQEMQRLEDAKNEKVLNIVPIGGLVMNTFARLENELNTVVELWDESTEGSSEDCYSDQGTTTEVLTLKVTQKKATPSLNESKSMLHVAVAADQIEKVEKILEIEWDTINNIDSNGWTPLHSAAYSGNADICKLLLQVPTIDVNIKNRDGASVLHYFVRHPYTEKRKEAVLMMLEKGLDINNGTRHGETPLHSAAFKGLNDVVALLLQNGANPNSLTQGGETPLHYAVTTGRANVVNTLLIHGALFNICSKRGTPLDLARHAKLSHIVSILENGPEIDNFSWRKNNRTQLLLNLQQQPSSNHILQENNNNNNNTNNNHNLNNTTNNNNNNNSFSSNNNSSRNLNNNNHHHNNNGNTSPNSQSPATNRLANTVFKRTCKIEIGSRGSPKEQ